MRKRLFLIQAVLLLAGIVFSALRWGAAEAMAMLYGGSMVLVITALLHWRHRVAALIAEKDAGRSLRIIYRTAVERFLLTVVMFAVGIGVLKLEPLVLIGGFVLVLSAQMLDWFIESRMMRNHGKRSDPYLW
jgi:ATP synthase protein I